jgi:hypothetical protein
VVDVIGIEEAQSMCEAYNAGMHSSDAQYKVYLHQDVFIREHNFILYLLERFRQDKSIGMIGMVGGNGMPMTGVTYLAWNAGRTQEYTCAESVYEQVKGKPLPLAYSKRVAKQR